MRSARWRRSPTVNGFPPGAASVSRKKLRSLIASARVSCRSAKLRWRAAGRAWSRGGGGAVWHGWVEGGPTDVVAHRAPRRVALGGGLLQRLGEDGVEIAAERPSQPLPSGAAFRQQASRFGRLGRERRDGAARERRPPFAQPPDGGRRGRFQARRRVGSAKQLVEQHAERVDVGGGGHRLPLDLFGRGGSRRRRGGWAGAGGGGRRRRGAAPPRCGWWGRWGWGGDGWARRGGSGGVSPP